MLKSFGLLFATLAAPLKRWNVKFAVILVAAFFVMVAVYTVIFHELMALEGRQFTWATSLYWTFVTMSTLGFGDIVFESDLGRMFSVVVLLTGSVFILVLLPFLFIQFIFTPWMSQRENARAPRRVDKDLRDHVVVCGVDPISDALIDRAKAAGMPYVVLIEELDEALRLTDRGYDVMVGSYDDPDTYRDARVQHAALVALTLADEANTNLAFTVREIDEQVPIAALANRGASIDVLELAGCDEVVHLGDLLGRAMARRVVGIDAKTHVIGEFGDLRIAEASVNGTSLVGTTLREADLRNRGHVNVVGVWQDAHFEPAGPDTRLTERSVLILAGSERQLAAYDRQFGVERHLDAPVLVLGGGRVGRAAARALGETGVEAVVVELRPERIREEFTSVLGDAADLSVLETAGLEQAAAALVTSHADDTNVYLTLYLRRLRPDLQVISRATRDRNVSSLQRAGADAVLSYGSIGATALWNAMGRNRRLVVAEGLEIFRVPMPTRLQGESLSQCQLGGRTGCHVVAIARGDHLEANPDPDEPLPAGGDLVLIGDEDAEERFVARYGGRRD
ncbi:potassium channel family protein [Egicoccus halophilus]|uniref:Potassium transporter n=1 Tax=Egicoccus halophilus TaxID=1670830 RepID=A0A8J3EUW6_9ACTN|nr:potassium channel protein [Egicoccus halophilus]GGI08508.1 potassium transporter [Egicoccus halophilus]